jgi:hypothetical protein
MKKNIVIGLLIAMVIVCLASGSAMAGTGLGFRIGMTSGNVSQLHYGFHYVSKPYLGPLHFRPSIEFGKGSGVEWFQANLDVFAIRWEEANSLWSIYMCGGPALTNTNTNPDYLRKKYNSSGYGNYSSFGSNYLGEDLLEEGKEWGAGIVTGIEHKSGFMIEMRVGTSKSSPRKKFTFGWTF